MFHDKDLEPQAEAMLAELAADIDSLPAPNEAVMGRVRAAVRHEINERWLASQSSPPPGEDVLHRTRAAVREELSRSSTGRAIRRTLIPQLLAALAAAAMLAACVGLIRYMGLLQPAARTSPLLVAAQQHVDLFVEAAEHTLASDEFSESVLTELDSINARLTGMPQQRGDEGVLRELDQAIQDVFETSDDTDGLMGAAAWGQEVVG